MKRSIYTTALRDTRGHAILVSSLNKTAVRLDRASTLLWDRGHDEELFRHPRLRALAKSFLTGEDTEEFARALHYLLDPPALPRTLHATVVVTMQCNQRCAYCHEAPRLSNVRMSGETALAAAAFIARRAEASRSRRLSLYFYGGEPLINLEAIETVVATVRSSSDARISIMIPTNALLLDDAHLARIAALGDVLLQVTLDGPPDVHDRRRPRTDPRISTFDATLRAIRRATDRVRVVIRTNVDKENLDTVPDLLDLLVAEEILPLRARWYASSVTPVLGGNEHTDNLAFTDLEWAAALDRIWGAQAARGLPLRDIEIGEGLCGISRPSVFTIDPTGGIHPCTGMHSRATSAQSSVHDPVPPTLWPTRPATDFPRACRRCFFLPWCGGGCTAQSTSCSTRPHCPRPYFDAILPRYVHYKYGLGEMEQNPAKTKSERQLVIPEC